MKKLIAAIAAAILVFGLTTTALAAPMVGYGGGVSYGFMCDNEGNFLDRDAFEEKLDKAIEDELIRAEDKEYYLEMYDYCASYGGGGFGMRGGCCSGRGFGRR